MKNFQIIILVAFTIFIALGVFLFATFRGTKSIKDIQITIWGEEEKIVFNDFLNEFNKNTDGSFKVQYKQIEGEDFADKVIESIASGQEPDIILLSSGDLVRFEDKILPIPFEVISERNFKDAFIEGGEIFLSNEGVLALPFSVDPLVTYWNRDILQSSGLSSPPKFWSEFFPFVERITEKDKALNITRSAVAMGEYQNVNNAKEIILSMIMQNGNSVVVRDNVNNSLVVILDEILGRPIPPAESAIRFYTEFSNPTKTSYSWNRSLPNSDEAFSSGDLALYFGFAGELAGIKAKNPNLNFDIALFPQSSNEANQKVYGNIKALAILKRSKNTNAAISVASALIREDNIKSLVSITNLPPVRRALLSRGSGLVFEDLFYQSALIAKSFLDPNSKESDLIFESLVDRVVSGSERINQAVRRSTSELNNLIVDK